MWSQTQAVLTINALPGEIFMQVGQCVAFLMQYNGFIT